MPKNIRDKIKNKPKLAIGLDFYYQAFNRLCTERPPSESIASIPWSKIQMYAEHYGMDFEEAERFHIYMSRMDDAYIGHFIEKNKKNANNKQPETAKRNSSRKNRKG